ncbi:uncharacterized protein EV422DRAFT_510273 [Fimicolochytrium jonesii]|uniref:uncharacterized protein n=1 Tax=Fimicolochytrium jonesii TaxID=1396493 RepID=UPI0022FEC614|nr:uncharacterized protein EV422DRAFT_510273 [Fimicolochytrium jonesii]KAI8815814.1 hypothetical protein EV422DRAFT_510273 [Fimicolochytrium jonesii]
MAAVADEGSCLADCALHLLLRFTGRPLVMVVGQGKDPLHALPESGEFKRVGVGCSSQSMLVARARLLDIRVRPWLLVLGGALALRAVIGRWLELEAAASWCFRTSKKVCLRHRPLFECFTHVGGNHVPSARPNLLVGCSANREQLLQLLLGYPHKRRLLRLLPLYHRWRVVMHRSSLSRNFPVFDELSEIEHRSVLEGLKLIGGSFRPSRTWPQRGCEVDDPRGRTALDGLGKGLAIVAARKCSEGNGGYECVNDVEEGKREAGGGGGFLHGV